MHYIYEFVIHTSGFELIFIDFVTHFGKGVHPTTGYFNVISPEKHMPPKPRNKASVYPRKIGAPRTSYLHCIGNENTQVISCLVQSISYCDAFEFSLQAFDEYFHQFISL